MINEQSIKDAIEYFNNLILTDEDIVNINIKCMKFIINELEPRVKKYNLKLNDFTPKLTYMIIILEYKNMISRNQTRNILDESCKSHIAAMQK